MPAEGPYLSRLDKKCLCINYFSLSGLFPRAFMLILSALCDEW